MSQGKERPFLSPVSYKDVKPLKGETSKKEMSNWEKDFAVDIVLEQFKHSTAETKSVNSLGSNKLMSATTGEYETQELGKRKRGLFLLVSLVNASHLWFLLLLKIT